MSRLPADALDPAKADPDGPCGGIQAYNSGPDEDDPAAPHPCFGEIEMQLRPLRQDGDGAWRTRATTTLMAWQGARNDVLATARRVLGLSDIELFG